VQAPSPPALASSRRWLLHRLPFLSDRLRIDGARGGSQAKAALIAPDRSFLYVVVPKAANSTVKRVLWRLLGTEVADDEAMETLHGGPGPFLGFPDMSSAELHEVLKGRGVFRFTFVRNPYERLVSAYQDKVRALGRHRPIDYAGALGLARQPTFEAFVRKVAAQPDEASDWHWMSQHRCALVDLVSYDFIGRVERFDEHIAQVLQRIGAPAGLYDPAASVNRLGLGDAPLFSDELAELAFKRYRRDFEIFGYSPDSYRGAT